MESWYLVHLFVWVIIAHFTNRLKWWVSLWRWLPTRVKKYSLLSKGHLQTGLVEYGHLVPYFSSARRGIVNLIFSWKWAQRKCLPFADPVSCNLRRNRSSFCPIDEPCSALQSRLFALQISWKSIPTYSMLSSSKYWGTQGLKPLTSQAR